MMKTFLNSTAKFVIILVLFVTLILMNYHIWKKDAKQEEDIHALQQELQLQRSENEKIQHINEDLRRKINSLKQGSHEMIEEEARDNFGMVGEGETFYHFDDKPAPPPQTTQ